MAFQWQFWKKQIPQSQSPPIKTTDFGLLTNANQSEIIPLSFTATIEPDEVAKLIGNAKTKNLRIDLDGVVEDGLEVGNLTEEEWLAEYYKMLKDDAVQDALKFFHAYLYSANYYIEPASEDEKDLDIAAFIADSLGLDGKRTGKYTYGRLLKAYYLSLIYRRSAVEIVLTIGKNGLAVLDKLVPIHPFNIKGIERDSSGGPKRLIIQGFVQGDNPRYVETKLPMVKTVLFVNDDDGNFRGNSVLDGAWVSWKIKRALLQLINAGFERFMLGIPVLKLPKSVVKDSLEWKQARTALTTFAAKPRTGMLVPDGYEFTIEVVNAQMPDALPYLRMVTDGIYRSMGVGFLTSEEGGGSNYKLAESLFKSSGRYAHSLLLQFLQYVNNYLIPKLVLVNWPEVENFPTLKANDLESVEPASILNAYSQMVSASFNNGSFDPELFRAIAENAPQNIRRWMGFDADRNKELVGSRRKSVR